MKIFPDIVSVLPSLVEIETEEEKLSFAGAEKINYNDITLALNKGAVTLTADTTPVKFITLTFPCALPADCRFLGDAWERGYGDFEWRGFVFSRVMPWYFFAVSGGVTAGFGVKVRPDAFCSFRCDPNSIKLYLDVRSGGKGVIPGGKTINCCELVCGEYEGELFAAQQSFLKLLVSDAIFPKNKVYGFNNWYYAYGKSSREEVLGNAAHLARLTKGLKNRPFMVIDDCWQPLRPTGFIGGPWRAGNEAFGDMKTLAAEMAAMDVIPGIWYRPTQNRDEALGDEMFSNKADDVLDVSRQDVLDYIAGDVKCICDWGFKLIKYDYSTCDITHRWGRDMGTDVCADDVVFADRSKTAAMLIKDLYRTVYEAADGRAEILGCNCIGHLGVGYMHLNRTGDDTSGYDFERTRFMGVNTLAFRMPQHGIFYDVDADCVGITEHIPWEKNEQWLKMLALSGTPLFVSVAPDLLNDEQNEILKYYLTIASEKTDIAVPVDVLNNTTPEKWLTDGETTEYKL